MKLQVSVNLGVPVGGLVDLHKYDLVGIRNGQARYDSGLKQLFNIGWVGLGYRARAAEQHWMTFAAAFQRPDTSEHHYAQDAALFDFLTNACAAAEAAVFASYVAARSAETVQLLEKDLKKSQKDMVLAVQGNPLTAALGNFLSQSLSDPVSIELFTLRDVMLHRGRPPRWVTVSIGTRGNDSGRTTIPSNPKSTPQNWLPDLQLHAQMLGPYVAWLRKHIDGAAQDLLTVLKPKP